MASKIMEHNLLDVLSRHMDDRMIIDSQHDLTKGRSCVTNLVTFYNGVSVTVIREEQLVFSILTSIRPLTLYHTASLTLNCRAMCLLDGLFNG